MKSVFFSLVACLRNFRALVVFGLSWMLLLIFLLLAVTLLASAIDLGDSLGALMFPLMLLVAAMFFWSSVLQSALFGVLVSLNLIEGIGLLAIKFPRAGLGV